jgi:release factor glutamine methyltransferase
MKFTSNLLKTLVAEYTAQLQKICPVDEAKSLIYWLTEAYFGVNRLQLAMHPDTRLNESEMLKLLFAVKALKQHKPVQYVVGEMTFSGLRIKVSPEVLIPRQETEQLVQWIAESEINRVSGILDVCTGSGCIALALKNLLPQTDVMGYDFSDQAVAKAKENAALNDLEVSFFVESVFTPAIEGLPVFDVVVSNPPYVLESEKELMRPNVLNFEPHEALFVPDDQPLLFYESVLKQSATYLRKGGRIYFEINEAKGEEMIHLLRVFGFTEIEVKNDLNGKPRMVRAVR